jgi:hypothetical protein
MTDRTTAGGFLGVPIGLVLGAVVGGVVGGSCVQGNIFVRLIAALIGAVTCAAVAAFVGIYIGAYLGGRLDAQEARVKEAEFRALRDRAFTELQEQNWDQRETTSLLGNMRPTLFALFFTPLAVNFIHVANVCIDAGSSRLHGVRERSAARRG